MKKLERFILREDPKRNKFLKIAKRTLEYYWPSTPQALLHYQIWCF